MKKVAVLLSTYSGERFLRAQLDSLLAQEGVELKVLVRDDGPKNMSFRFDNCLGLITFVPLRSYRYET